MENQRPETPPKTIIRLAEVLRRTGFSRSTLYGLIAKGDFPHQMSLGARSVGWIEQEVAGWIARRASMRPASESQTWLVDEELLSKTSSDDTIRNTPAVKGLIMNRYEAKTQKLHGSSSAPNLAQLELIGTSVYVDRSTGAIWFQIPRPKQSAD